MMRMPMNLVRMRRCTGCAYVTPDQSSNPLYTPARFRRYFRAPQMQQIGIGLAGLGTVGAGVYKHLGRNRALLMERLGLELVVRKIVVRDLARTRSISAPAAMVTTRWQELID